MNAAPKPYRLALLVLPDHAANCISGMLDPLFVANWLTGGTLFQWQILSLDGAPVRASNGMLTAVDAGLDTAQPQDAVLVAASFGTADHAQNKRLLNWLRRAARFGVEVGALETGSEVLAAAGLLDGHEAAIHWYNLEGFRERYPQVQARDARHTLGQGRMTCSGGTAAFDLGLALITRQASATLAAEVARQLMVQGTAAAPTPSTQTARRVIAKAEAVMRDTLEHPLPCRDLAARLGVSDRQLQRHFASHLGLGVAEHYRSLRLERAHKYVQLTDLSVTEIALACGFGSIEHFSRSYRRAFGVAPRSDRRQTTQASVFRPSHPERTTQ